MLGTNVFMRSEADIAAEADLMHAKAFSAQLRAERDDSARQLLRLDEALTLAMSSRSNKAINMARQRIRNAESDLCHLDRMIEAIGVRFPEAISRCASPAQLSRSAHLRIR